MGRIFTAACGLTLSAAAAGGAYNLMPNQKSAPPDIAELETNIADIDAAYDKADLTREAVINLLGAKCADSVYRGTINQPLANLPDSQLAILLADSETGSCGRDLAEVEAKVRALRDPFEAMALAYTNRQAAITDMQAATEFKPSVDHTDELIAALAVGSLGLGITVIAMQREKIRPYYRN